MPETTLTTSASPPAPTPAPHPLSLLWKALLQRLRGWGVYLTTRVLVDVFLLFEGSVDVRIYGLEKLRELQRMGRTPLLTIWHGQGFLPITVFRTEHLCLYASHTRDDNYAQHLRAIRWWTLRLIERLGFRVMDAAQFQSEARGVMQFVEILRQGTGSVIAADGPAGPIYEAKPGPTFLAKKTGVSLLPIGVAISHGFEMDNWDRFEIPFPFSSAVIVLGEAIPVPPKASEAELNTLRLALETEMRRLTAEAQRRL